MEGEDFYTPTEAERLLARPGRKALSERRIRQMLQAGELEGRKDENGRWHVAQHEVHRLMEERRNPVPGPPELSETPERSAELLEIIRELERERGRLEARLELTERAESTMQADRERLLEDLERERERVERLERELEQSRRGFWRTLFGR